MRRTLRHGITGGLVSGLILGGFLKSIENSTESRVYILLLNVDFVPFLPQPLPEWIEFGLHLLVSIAIALLYFQLLQRFPRLAERSLSIGMLAGVAAVPLFIPLTLASARTPAIHDLTALTWWTAGHLLYGLALGLYGKAAHQSYG